MNLLEQFAFAASITGPILLLLLLGAALRRAGMLDDAFLGSANALVFRVAMPAMLFIALARQPLYQSIDVPLLIAGLGGTTIVILLVLAVGRVILPREQRGVFVQGSYRGNLAILGLALSLATYGDGVLPLVAVYVAAVTTLYNVVAVWLLSADGRVLRSVATNPIILGIVAGAAVSSLPFGVPQLMLSTGQYLSDMVLPVALLCIGASLRLASLRTHGWSVGLAVGFKLVASPCLMVLLGGWLGLRDQRLGVLFFMAAAPTASASYIMARQMTNQGDLAAEIVAVTTIVGVVTYTVGLAALRFAGWV